MRSLMIRYNLLIAMFCGISILVGGGFIFAGVIGTVNTNNFLDNAYCVEAKVDKIDIIDEDYITYVSFEDINGNNRAVKLDYWNSSLKVGDNIEVYCSADTDEVRAKSSIGLCIIFTVVGIVTTLIGVVVLIVGIIFKRYLPEMYARGQIRIID